LDNSKFQFSNSQFISYSLKINSIIYSDNYYYFGGCTQKDRSAKFKSAIFKSDLIFDSAQEFNFNIGDQNENCIQSLLISAYSKIVMTISSTSDFLTYNIFALSCLSVLSNENQFYSSSSNSEVIPMVMSTNNEILIVNSIKDPLDSKNKIRLEYFNSNDLNLIREEQLINTNEIQIKTILITDEGDRFFGGKLLENNHWIFWVSY